MVKISEIIDMAASRIGLINVGEALDAANSTRMLYLLKFTLDEMSIRFFGAKAYEKVIPGKQIITIGTDSLGVSGDIAERPSSIDAVTVIVNNVKYPQNIKSYSDYLKIPYTNVNAIPNAVYLREDYPYIELYFYPGFGITGEVQILGKSYMTSEDLTFSDYLELPREYMMGVMSKLALKAAPHFSMTPDQSLVIEASSGEKHIKQKLLSEQMVSLDNDFIGQRGFNMITGRYN